MMMANRLGRGWQSPESPQRSKRVKTFGAPTSTFHQGQRLTPQQKSECTGGIFTLNHYELRAWRTGSVHVWGDYRMGHSLGHDSGVHNHRRQAALAHRATALARGNRRSQHLLDAFLAQALTPARQAGGINRRLDLQIRFPRKDLPIGIFHLTPHRVLIR